jgi:hypothetical protein
MSLHGELNMYILRFFELIMADSTMFLVQWCIIAAGINLSRQIVQSRSILQVMPFQ